MEMIKACLYIVLLLFIPTYIVADDRDGCPTNLSRDQYLKVHGGKCYEFVVHRHLSWPKAESDCRTRGGHLVKVDDLAEEEYIMGNLRSYNFRGQGVWIGLTRPRDGASFTWVTGEPMQFQYWAPGQPGSGSGRRRRLLLDTIQQLIPTSLPSIHLPKLIHEDCVLLKYTDSGLWHDYPCEKLDLLGLVPENFPYVCEYPHNSINTNPPKPNIAMPITTARTTSAPGTDFPVTTTTSAPGTDFPITTTSSALGTDFPPSTQAPINTTGATTAATSKTTASPTNGCYQANRCISRSYNKTISYLVFSRYSSVATLSICYSPRPAASVNNISFGLLYCYIYLTQDKLKKILSVTTISTTLTIEHHIEYRRTPSKLEVGSDTRGSSILCLANRTRRRCKHNEFFNSITYNTICTRTGLWIFVIDV